MFRALLLGGAFVLVSPSLRGWVFGLFDSFSQEVNLHSTIALIMTGMLVFGTILGLQMTAQKKQKK